MIVRFLESMGATVWSQVAMYKAVAHPVLLYGSVSWVVTGDMLKVLTAFHHWAARRITEITDKRGSGGEWEYPAVEEAMESVRIHPIRVYIKRRQTTLSERFYCRTIYSLLAEAEIMPGTSRMVTW